MSKRRAWFEAQPDLDPGKLVFIDETWTATNMARTHGRCARGERLRMGFPHGHRKTTTLVAGLRLDGMVAPMVLDGPINLSVTHKCGNFDVEGTESAVMPCLAP